MLRIVLLSILVAALHAAVPPTRAAVATSIAQAQGFLLDQQRADGSLSPGGYGVAGTAFVLSVVLQAPHAAAADDPRVRAAFALLRRHRQDDGGIYDPKEGLGDYGTAFTLMALMRLGTPRDEALVRGCQDYLFGLQNRREGDRAHGGIGYGNHAPGDENVPLTALAVQALIESGVPPSDERLGAARAFLERCQHLTAVNPAPGFGDSGMAVYSPKVAPSQPSPADAAAETAALARGEVPGYGSVTYAMIATYLALDLRADDPRVAAALRWCLANYRFDANPGMRPGAGRQGLFHYHALMARTFALIGRDRLELPDGRVVDWRADLHAALSGEARPGATPTWRNAATRWGEGLPHIATAYAVSALKHIAASLGDGPDAAR